MVVTDDELFCLLWSCSYNHTRSGTWWIIDGESPWEHLREYDLVEIYKTRYPITKDDRRQVLYNITPEGRAHLCSIEISRIVGLCLERNVPQLLLPFITEMNQEELPELITHVDALVRKAARERYNALLKREKRKQLIWRGAKS